MSTSAPEPRLSLVIVAFEMQREIERTVRSLAPAHQLGLDSEHYEVIVIDNGSRQPLERAACEHPGLRLRWLRIEEAGPSPAAAINAGIALAAAPLIGAMIDGARLASPGLLKRALDASRIDRRAIIASLGFHLGAGYQWDTIKAGYDREAEDALLRGIGWPEDGYRLFEVSVLAGSSRRGWFETPSESNALFMARELWEELGGFDERFAKPGGGLVNIDLFDRACALPGVQLVNLLGEGTFHQLHGGATTNAPSSRWPELNEEYRQLRGKDASFPEIRPLVFGAPSPHVIETMRA